MKIKISFYTVRSYVYKCVFNIYTPDGDIMFLSLIREEIKVNNQSFFIVWDSQ